MCLSTVYQMGADGPEELCDHIGSAVTENGSITFTDIMGATTTVKGTIERVDLVGNKIYVATSSPIAVEEK